MSDNPVQLELQLTAEQKILHPQEYLKQEVRSLVNQYLDNNHVDDFFDLLTVENCAKIYRFFR